MNGQERSAVRRRRRQNRIRILIRKLRKVDFVGLRDGGKFGRLVRVVGRRRQLHRLAGELDVEISGVRVAQNLRLEWRRDLKAYLMLSRVNAPFSRHFSFQF